MTHSLKDGRKLQVNQTEEASKPEATTLSQLMQENENSAQHEEFHSDSPVHHPILSKETEEVPESGAQISTFILTHLTRQEILWRQWKL